LMFSVREIIYHLYVIILSFLLTLYFITILKSPKRKALIILSAVFWPLTGIVNFTFFQPINILNTNMILFESFFFITLSLYFIYRVIKDDLVENLFLYPHFWVCILLLVLWCSSFFLWAFLNILYRDHWQYLMLVLHVEAIINCIVYTGLAWTLFFFNKKMEVDGES
jgi:hypothetical protein